MVKASLEERFWNRVKREDGACWLWLGGALTKGRGTMSVDGKTYTAPAVAWLIFHGSWPEPGLYVCHSCDNPRCVNPDHLWLGTPTENMQDCIKKGRFRSPPPEKNYFATPEGKANKRRGSTHPNAKLNDVTAGTIAVRLARGERPTDLAREYGVGRSSVLQIRAGTAWRIPAQAALAEAALE